MESKLSRRSLLAGRQFFALFSLVLFSRNTPTPLRCSTEVRLHSAVSQSATVTTVVVFRRVGHTPHSSDVEADNLTLSAYCCNFANVQSLWRVFGK